MATFETKATTASTSTSPWKEPEKEPQRQQNDWQKVSPALSSSLLIAFADLLLSTELTTQLRQASTQRQPVLLVRGSQGIEVALAQVTSKDPRISGLVILGAADAKTTERAPKKLRIVVLPDNDEALKAAEKWMRSQGFS